MPSGVLTWIRAFSEVPLYCTIKYPSVALEVSIETESFPSTRVPAAFGNTPSVRVRREVLVCCVGGFETLCVVSLHPQRKGMQNRESVRKHKEQIRLPEAEDLRCIVIWLLSRNESFACPRFIPRSRSNVRYFPHNLVHTHPAFALDRERRDSLPVRRRSPEERNFRWYRLQ